MAKEKDEMAVNEEETHKNKHLSLRVFCITLELIGWILIFGGTLWFMYILSGAESAAEKTSETQNILTVISWFSFDFVFLGLMAVILAHLARYVFDRDFSKSLLLRCGDKILYLFAILTVAWAGFQWFYHLECIEDLHWRMLLAQPLILPSVGKVLVLVCAGQILKRILSVIEEYKSLV